VNRQPASKGARTKRQNARTVVMYSGQRTNCRRAAGAKTRAEERSGNGVNSARGGGWSGNLWGRWGAKPQCRSRSRRQTAQRQPGGRKMSGKQVFKHSPTCNIVQSARRVSPGNFSVIFFIGQGRNEFWESGACNAAQRAVKRPEPSASNRYARTGKMRACGGGDRM